MNDWSDYALGRLRKQKEDQRYRDEKFLERQRIKKAHGSPLWHDVRSVVKKNAEDLNAKANETIIRFDVTQNTKLSVHARLDADVRTLEAMFDDETGKLSWQCSNGKAGEWELAVRENGGVQFQWGMVPTTPASIAKQMLDALLFD